MGVGPMNLVITNDALYQLSYTSELRRRGTYSIIPNPAAECKVFFALFFVLLRVSLNAEETVTVFPALFFYPKAGGRRLKH